MRDKLGSIIKESKKFQLEKQKEAKPDAQFIFLNLPIKNKADSLFILRKKIN